MQFKEEALVDVRNAERKAGHIYCRRINPLQHSTNYVPTSVNPWSNQILKLFCGCISTSFSQCPQESCHRGALTFRRSTPPRRRSFFRQPLSRAICPLVSPSPSLPPFNLYPLSSIPHPNFPDPRPAPSRPRPANGGRGHVQMTSGVEGGLAQKETTVLIGCVSGTLTRGGGPKIPNFCGHYM